MAIEMSAGDTKIIENGRFTNGQSSWWVNRCDAPAVQAQRSSPNAPGTTVEALFDKYNLFGAFAMDCSKPAKAVENWRYINRRIDGGRRPAALH